MEPVYHLAIDWRRAKFFIAHPTVLPAMDDILTLPADRSCFLAIADITDVCLIRNWLHQTSMMGSYYLFGCYARLTSFFQGIVFVFDNVTDLLLFRHRWMPVIA